MSKHLLLLLKASIPAALLAVFLICTAALADDDDDDEGVSGHCNRVLLLRYDAESGMPANVEFDLGQDDFNAGQQTVTNHGHMHWWSNTRPWRIRIVRDAWDQTSGTGFPDAGGVEDIHLWIRHGASEANWIDVTTATQTWISANVRGFGKYTGVDWKVSDVGWDSGTPYGIPPAGAYSTTVTFTIERGS